MILHQVGGFDPFHVLFNHEFNLVLLLNHYVIVLLKTIIILPPPPPPIQYLKDWNISCYEQ